MQETRKAGEEEIRPLAYITLLVVHFLASWLPVFLKFIDLDRVPWFGAVSACEERGPGVYLPPLDWVE